MGDSISTVEAIKYCGGIAAVPWRLFSTVEGEHQYMWEDSISTVEAVQYYGGCSVLWSYSISTVGDSISTVGDSIST